MAVEEIKALLQELNFPPRRVTEQTAFCILALANTMPRRGLLAGHTCLADGARIHDVLDFVRQDIGHPVAENTRESYRKASLRPLMEAGWVIRHQLSTNDPNTYYRLHPDFACLLALPSGPERDVLIERLRLPERRRPRQRVDLRHPRDQKVHQRVGRQGQVVVQVAAGDDPRHQEGVTADDGGRAEAEGDDAM